jgi:glycerophosphoryl diester phosphodiesterase
MSAREIPANRVPAIIAHRGASQVAPENTLAAFRMAWEMGSNAVEGDLRLTRDGRIVVLHDEGTFRTTGFDAPVSALTLEEIQALDAGSLWGARWKGERIPALREVLALTPPGQRLFLEIKDSATLLEPLGRDLAASIIEPDRITLIGFDHDLMVEAKRRFPEYPALWLYEIPAVVTEEEWPGLRREMISRAVRGGLDGLDLGAHPLLDAAFVREIHEEGLSVAVWTVNDLTMAGRLIDAGVDGLTTDVPDLLLALRDDRRELPADRTA